MTLPNVSAAPSASAAPSPDRGSGAHSARGGSESFQHILRKTSEDETSSDTPAPPGQRAGAKPDGGNQSKTDKREKQAKSEETNSQAVVMDQPNVPAQQKASFSSLLSLVTYQTPKSTTGASSTEGNTPVEDNAGSGSTAFNLVPLVGVPGTGVPSPEKERDPVAAKAAQAQGMQVPPSYDLIAQMGLNWTNAGAVTNIVDGKVPNALNTTAALESIQTATSKPEPLIVNAPPVPEAVGPELSPKTLAFAMRLENTGQTTELTPSSNTETSPSLNALAATASAGIGKIQPGAGDSQLDSQSNGHSSHENGTMFGAQYFDGTSGVRPSSDKSTFGADALGTVKGTQVDDPLTAAAGSEPVRNLLLQLKGDDNRRVDVRLIDRGGELHVSVKSADADLAQRLQDHMPELTSRLEQQRFASDVWMPRLTETAKAESGGANSFEQSNQNSQGGSEMGGGGRRQNDQSQQRPDWVDLLESQSF